MFECLWKKKQNFILFMRIFLIENWSDEQKKYKTKIYVMNTLMLLEIKCTGSFSCVWCI